MKPFPINCPECRKRLMIKRPELVGKRVKCPQCQGPILIKAPETPVEPSPTQPVLKEPEPVVTDVPIIVDEEQNQQRTAQQRLKSARKRKKKQQRTNWIILGVMAMLALGTAGFVYTQYSQPLAQQTSAQQVPVRDNSSNLASVPEETKATQQAQLSKNSIKVPSTLESATGSALNLEFVPAGTKLLIHWHPRQFTTWGETEGELWQCGGLFSQWLENYTEQVCAAKPGELEQLSFYLIPGVKGTAPYCVAKFKPVAGLSQTTWRQRHQGEKRQLHGQIALAQNNRVWFWPEKDLCLSVPEQLLEESLQIGRSSELTTTGIDRLIEQTKESVSFTMLGDVRVMKEITNETLTEAEQQLLLPPLEWFGQNVETVLWELNLTDQIDSRVTLHKGGLISNQKLIGQMESQLRKTGVSSWGKLKTFLPNTEGARTVLARFPAMLELVARMSRLNSRGDQIELTTQLSERAAPNLLLASYLTWQQWGAAGALFGQPETLPEKVKPETFEERMKSPYPMEFSLTPLQEAFQIIGEEIGITFKLDGDALKNEGYTQNMQQNFDSGKMPAEKAVSLILGQYPKMILVAEPETMSAIVTTQPAAEEKGWTAYPLPESTP